MKWNINMFSYKSAVVLNKQWLKASAFTLVYIEINNLEILHVLFDIYMYKSLCMF